MSTWPPQGVDPNSFRHHGLLVTVPSDELHRLLDAALSDTMHTRSLRAMALVELLYRAGVRTREAYECAWVVFMAGTPLEQPPYWLCAPSEMSPHHRSWVCPSRPGGWH